MKRLFAVCVIVTIVVTMSAYVYKVNHAGLVARIDSSNAGDEKPAAVPNGNNGQERNHRSPPNDSVTTPASPFQLIGIGTLEMQPSLAANEGASTATNGTDPEEKTSNVDANKDAAIVSNEAAAKAPDRSKRLFTDSFEAGEPIGWNRAMWNATGAKPGSYESGLQTTTEVMPPRTGGKHTLRQWWHDNLSSWAPEFLTYTLPQKPAEGDVFEFEYYLMYDANFNDNKTFIKSVILRNEKGFQCYIDSHVQFGGPGVGVQFWQTTDTNWLFANVNGGRYVMPHGEWVHFKWQIKVATQDRGNPRNGYLYGWINGVQRWKHDNINTIYAGRYQRIDLNTTFNDTISGPNQKRYWDLFSVRRLERPVDGE